MYVILWFASNNDSKEFKTREEAAQYFEDCEGPHEEFYYTNIAGNTDCTFCFSSRDESLPHIGWWKAVIIKRGASSHNLERWNPHRVPEGWDHV